MSNPHGDTGQDDERPEPRYGAYAPRSEGPEGHPTEDPQSPGHPGQGGQHNPYGQPSWGSPGGSEPGSSGGSPGLYGESPYGGHSGEPAAQQRPGAHSPQHPGDYPAGGIMQKPKRPSSLVLAMVLMLVAGGLSLIWGIYTIVAVQAEDAAALMSEPAREAMMQSLQADPQLQELSPDEALEMMLVVLGVAALIWGLILLAIYVTLAFVGTMTGNVGRILATIWLAGSVLFLLLGFNGASYAIIVLTVLASLAALVLLWLPASNTFVQQRRASKEAQRQASFGGYQPGPPPGTTQTGPGQPGPGQPGGPQGPQSPYGGPNPYGS